LYDKKNNVFTLYNDYYWSFRKKKNFDKDIDSKKEKYIPMLYSMVNYDEKSNEDYEDENRYMIDWKKAELKNSVGQKKSSTFNSNHYELNKVLLVFGEDRLDTLNFSWLASFELTLDDSEVNEEKIREIGEEIMGQERGEIIIPTQGVLFTYLDDVIVDFKQRQKQFEHTLNLIKDIRHNIKNFGFKGALRALYKRIEGNSDLLNHYFRLESLDSLRDFTLDILFSFNNLPGKSNLLLKKEKCNYYTKLLTLIDKSAKGNEKDFHDAVKGHKLNTIADDDLSSVFSLLLNLYSNSRNKAETVEGDFDVEIVALNEKVLEIYFRNDGVMGKEHIDYYNDYSHVKTKGDGIKSIKESLYQLNHIDLMYFTDEETTTAKLTIHDPT
ncbi:MAG: hypothetical protein AAF901_03900, partial [Bacteroidota bacterium]